MKKLHIVLLDDDEEEGFLIREAFHNNEMVATFDAFSRGEQLVDHLSAMFPKNIIDQPVLVILDLYIAARDGQDMLKQLKGHPLFRYIPVIIYSSSSDPTLIGACYEYGATAFVPKANSYNELLTIVNVLTRFYSNQSIRLPVFESRTPI